MTELRRILVAGSRGWTDNELIRRVLPWSGNVIIIHGGALGADLLASEVAQERDFAQWEFLPDWDNLGKKAGPIRNGKMLKLGEPHEAFVFWDGESRGTKDMLNRLNRANVPTQLFVDKDAV